MAAQTERRKEIYALSINEIKDLLANVLQDNKIISANLIQSGLANTNYKIETHTGEIYVLRFHTRDTELAEKEFNLSNLLSNVELVPKFIHYESSNNFSIYPFSLVSFYQGEILSGVLSASDTHDRLSDVFHQLGVFLSKLNQNYYFDKPGLLDSKLVVKPFPKNELGLSNISSYINGCLKNKNFINRVDKKIIQNIEQLVCDNEKLLMMQNNDVSLVHGDFRPENILVIKTDNHIALSAILDWEFAYAGSIYGDMATLFRNLQLQELYLADAFVAGYHSTGRQLHPEWYRLAKLIDLINLCEFLTSEEARPKLFSSTIQLIDSTISILNAE